MCIACYKKSNGKKCNLQMKLTKFLTTQFAYIANSNDIFILLKLPLKFKSIFSPSKCHWTIQIGRPIGTNLFIRTIQSQVWCRPISSKYIMCVWDKNEIDAQWKKTPFSRRYISHIPFFPLLSSHKNLDAHLFVRQKFHEEYLDFFLSSLHKILFVSHIVIFVSPTHTPNEVRKYFNYIAGKWIKFQQFYRYFIWIASDF